MRFRLPALGLVVVGLGIACSERASENQPVSVGGTSGSDAGRGGSVVGGHGGEGGFDVGASGGETSTGGSNPSGGAGARSTGGTAGRDGGANGGEAGLGAGQGGDAGEGGKGGIGGAVVRRMPMPNPPGLGLPNPASYTVLGDGVVRDNVTGLEWQEPFSVEPESSEEGLAHCESLVLGGHDDWRVPTRIEAVSLLDFTGVERSIDLGAFPFTSTVHAVATVTRVADRPAHYRWCVNFAGGTTAFGHAWFRCVRTASTSVVRERFGIGTGARAGVVLDAQTGLVWQRVTPPEVYDWWQARDYCEGLELADFSNFRAPTMKELQTVVDDEVADPATDHRVFPDTPSEGFWTSSPQHPIPYERSAWIVNFTSGVTEPKHQHLTFRIRCVTENDGSEWPDGTPDPCEGITCSGHGSCAVVGDRAECRCASGFVPASQELGCRDIDECATNHGGCDARVACINTPGSRVCGECPAGYEGSGATCTPIATCPCENGGVCVAHGGGYACDCAAGFQGSRCETRFVMAASSSYHSCGLLSDGTLKCWGGNFFGESTPPAGRFASLAVGRDFSCAIRLDGSVACWGGNDAGQSVAPEGSFRELSAGARHACGLRTDGSVACWGDNQAGPALAPLGTFVAVAAGDAHSCAIRSDHRLVCWGDATFGTVPPALAATEFASVSVGLGQTCALRSDMSAVDCWRTTPVNTRQGPFTMLAGDAALRADGTIYPLWTSATPEGVFVGIWGNQGGVCGVRVDGSLRCSGGRNFEGHNDPPSGAFRRVSVGTSGICAIRADETAYCFGDAIEPGNYRDISVETDTACGVLTDGRLSCWSLLENHFVGAPGPFASTAAASGWYCGLDFEGGLHFGFPPNVEPAFTPPSGRFAAVASSWVGHCALDRSSEARCWGIFDTYGMFDAPSGPFSALGMSYRTACAIRATDRSLVCWGNNEEGQASPPDGTFKALSPQALCALRSDSAVTCWPSRPEPWMAPPDGEFEQVSGTSISGCAIDAAMALRCWGRTIR